jgi:hypothetical protein
LQPSENRKNFLTLFYHELSLVSDLSINHQDSHPVASGEGGYDLAAAMQGRENMFSRRGSNDSIS